MYKGAWGLGEFLILPRSHASHLLISFLFVTELCCARYSGTVPGAPSSVINGKEDSLSDHYLPEWWTVPHAQPPGILGFYNGSTCWLQFNDAIVNVYI